MYDGGIFHALYLVINTKEWGAADDFFQVYILLGSTNECKVFWIFERDFFWDG